MANDFPSREIPGGDPPNYRRGPTCPPAFSQSVFCAEEIEWSLARIADAEVQLDRLKRNLRVLKRKLEELNA